MLGKVSKRGCYRSLFILKHIPLQYLVDFPCMLNSTCLFVHSTMTVTLTQDPWLTLHSVSWIRTAHKLNLPCRTPALFINGKPHRNCWKEPNKLHYAAENLNCIVHPLLITAGALLRWQEHATTTNLVQQLCRERVFSTATLCSLDFFPEHSHSCCWMRQWGTVSSLISRLCPNTCIKRQNYTD